MASGSSTTSAHPLRACVEAVREGIDLAIDPAGRLVADPDYMPVEDKADLILDLTREITRLTAIRDRSLAGAQDVADHEAHKTPGTWLAAATRTTVHKPMADHRLGQRLLARPAVAAALLAGDLTADHATAVAQAVEKLPKELGADLIDDVERTLLGYCSDYTPPEIKRLGLRALEAAAPDEADAILERLLAAEERAALGKTRLGLRDQGDGTTKIHGLIPTLTAGVLTAALDAYSNPRRDHLDPASERSGTGEVEVQRLTPDQKRGRAFVDLIDHLPTDGLPTAGGTPVTVMVTIDEAKLRASAGLALLDADLGTLSAGAVRRLVCTHGAMPLVLGGDSIPLDLGRHQRLFSPGQVKAARATRPVCQADGCTIPSRWCEAHHLDPWAAGGRTDLANLALLCSHHHHRIHDPGYERHRARGPDGTTSFTFTRLRC